MDDTPDINFHNNAAPNSDINMARHAPVNVKPLNGPRFIITIDTEEEFDWSQPFTRHDHSTAHIGAIGEFQNLCDINGVQPVYLIDYPIANDPKAVALLGEFAGAGRAEIGMQLHPWVNPPFDETLTRKNSFACNLPAELERKKLQMLHAKIVDGFGLRPDIYRAGRYGVGASTPQILQELGITFDSSVRANFDYSPEGGPRFVGVPLRPYWLRPGEVIELPLTTVFRGGLQSLSKAVYFDLFPSQPSRSFMARTGILERIALTPEGVPLHKAIQGIDAALSQGVPILNFSFHSPSLEPGHTSYVRNDDDLRMLFEWWRGVFRHLQNCGVKPINIAGIKSALAG